MLVLIFHLKYSRFLHRLKCKIRNKARVKAFICNAYQTEEILNFPSRYFGDNVDTKAINVGQNVKVSVDRSNYDIPAIFFKNVGYVKCKGRSENLDDQDYCLAHRYVISNCELLRESE